MKRTTWISIAILISIPLVVFASLGNEVVILPREPAIYNPPGWQIPLVIAPKTYRILEELILCESGGRENVKVLDTNSQYSFGLVQFQLKTFSAFGKKYGVLPDGIEDAEIGNRILEPDLQIEIARRMIEEGLLEYHWKVCYRKMAWKYPSWFAKTVE